MNIKPILILSICLIFLLLSLESPLPEAKTNPQNTGFARYQLLSQHHKSMRKSLNLFVQIRMTLRNTWRTRNRLDHALVEKLKNQVDELVWSANLIQSDWMKALSFARKKGSSDLTRSQVTTFRSDLKTLERELESHICFLCGLGRKELTYSQNLKSLSRAQLKSYPNSRDCHQFISRTHCPESALDACRECCGKIKASQQSAIPEEKLIKMCQEECLYIYLLCRDGCGSELNCPINNNNCDIKPCQDCCLKTCPSGSALCETRCHVKQIVCLLKMIQQNEMQALSVLTRTY